MLRRLYSIALAALLVSERPAQAQVTSSVTFAPAAFGSVSSLASDLVNRQSVCAFGSLLTQGYSVTASGSGAGGAFTISNGTSQMPFEFQWAQTGGALSGTNVQPNVPLTGQYESNLLQGVGCLLGATSATAIVIVRAIALQQGTRGNYSGTLNIILTAQ